VASLADMSRHDFKHTTFHSVEFVKRYESKIQEIHQLIKELKEDFDQRRTVFRLWKVNFLFGRIFERCERRNRAGTRRMYCFSMTIADLNYNVRTSIRKNQVQKRTDLVGN
jgi:hypothetical protein